MNKWKFNVALDALAIAGAVSAQDSNMSFFITSSGAGNFGKNRSRRINATRQVNPIANAHQFVSPKCEITFQIR